MESVLNNSRVGWRFVPTNEELLEYYLKNKRLGHPISQLDIQEVQICDFDPSDLIDEDFPSGDRYFFCRRQFHPKSGGNQRKRKAKSGSWKRTGRIQDITREDSDEKIGTKSIFVYNDSNHSEFVIHEYELTEELGSPVQDEFDFVLCKLMRIKKKKASKKPKEDGPLSEEKAAINSKKKEAISGSKRRKCAADAASVSAACKERQVDLLAKSANDEGDQNNHPTSDIEYQNGSNHPTSNNGSNHPSSDIVCENGSNHPTSDIEYEDGSNHPTSDSDHENGSLVPTSDLEYENGSNKRAYSAFGDGEPIDHQSPISVAAVSTWEKGEASHGGGYTFEGQNNFEASNTSTCYEDTTSFSVDFDFNPNPKEESLIMNSDINQNSSVLNTLPGYSMSGTSQMMAYLEENHSPNDSAAMSSHGRSSNLFDNEYLGESTVSLTRKHVETCSLEEIDSHHNNQSGTVLYSASCDQSNLISPVRFDYENQNPSQGTCGSASVRKDLPVDLECEYTDKSGLEYSLNPLLDSAVFGSEFEEVQSNYNMMDVLDLDDLAGVTFPEIDSPVLEELTWLDVLSDTLSTEPQPIQTQNAPFGLC